jgi:hypothetical protein
VKSLRTRTNDGFLIPAKALPGTLRSFALKRMQTGSSAEVNECMLVASRKAKGKFRVSG